MLAFSSSRYLVLIGLLALGAWLMATVQGPVGERSPRRPTEAAVFAADGWTVGPPVEQADHGMLFVTREYHRQDGADTATVSIATGPEAKRVYRTGAEVAFQGQGYSVAAAPASLVPPAPQRAAQVLHGAHGDWLQVYTYGERRGLIGNGPAGWGLALLDTLLGQPNDYYLARVVVPLPAAGDAQVLADTLFPRIAAWYAAA